MSWRSWFSTEGRLTHVEELLVEMLELDGRSYELANRALLDGGDVAALRRTVSDTDHEVNLRVREVRRQLVVHGSVGGTEADLPAMLTYMSIVKDVERIGDYAKNILDIARARATRPGLAPLEDLRVDAEEVGSLLAEVTATFADRDADAARALLQRGADALVRLDVTVDEATVSDAPGHEAVPRALYARYLKRISAHLHNVLSSLVAPVAELDFHRGEATDDA